MSDIVGVLADHNTKHTTLITYYSYYIRYYWDKCNKASQSLSTCAGKPQKMPQTSLESLIWLSMLDDKLFSVVSVRYFPAFFMLWLAHVFLSSANIAKVKASKEQGLPYRSSLQTYEWHIKLKYRSCHDSKVHKQILQVEAKIITSTLQAKRRSSHVLLCHILMVWALFMKVELQKLENVDQWQKPRNENNWGAFLPASGVEAPLNEAN